MGPVALGISGSVVAGCQPADDASQDVAVTADPDGPVTIDTRLGQVQGNRESGILSLRYAEPPVGERRFLAPVPAAPWAETHIATEFPNRCMQLDRDGILGGTPAKPARTACSSTS